MGLLYRRRIQKERKMFTVLIQGPIKDHKFVEKNYNHYVDQGYQVHIHTWDSDEAKKLSVPYTSSSLEEDGEIVKFKHPLKQNKTLSSLYYYVRNVKEGLDKIDNLYIIKIRTDEFFSDISKIEKYLTLNPTKLVCSNIFLRKQKDQPFNISDHIIGMSYKNMYNTFNNLYSFFKLFRVLTHQNDIFNEEVFKTLWGKKYFGAQNLICRSYLYSLGHTKLDDIKLVVDNCYCIPVSELGDYFISNNYQSQTYNSKSKPWPENSKFGESKVW